MDNSSQFLVGSTSEMNCWVYQAGLVPYLEAWQWQKVLVQERMEQRHLSDVLLLMEHPSVYTLGKGAKSDDVHFSLNDPAYDVYRIERGGEVTHHCPNQIVAYPILNLDRFQQDLHWYLRQLESVVIDLLKEFGLSGYRIPGLTGVWVQDRKVAAIGIKVRRWITMHGFALNVCPDLEGFERIVPCGIRDRPVGAMSDFIPGIRTVDVQAILIRCFENAFGVTAIYKERTVPEEF